MLSTSFSTPAMKRSSPMILLTLIMRCAWKNWRRLASSICMNCCTNSITRSRHPSAKCQAALWLARTSSDAVCCTRWPCWICWEWVSDNKEQRQIYSSLIPFSHLSSNFVNFASSAPAWVSCIGSCTSRCAASLCLSFIRMRNQWRRRIKLWTLWPSRQSCCSTTCRQKRMSGWCNLLETFWSNQQTSFLSSSPAVYSRRSATVSIHMDWSFILPNEVFAWIWSLPFWRQRRCTNYSKRSSTGNWIPKQWWIFRWSIPSAFSWRWRVLAQGMASSATW